MCNMCEREGDDADIAVRAPRSVPALLREDHPDGSEPAPAAAALRHLPRQDPAAAAGAEARHQQELAGVVGQREVLGRAGLGVELLGGRALRARLGLALFCHQRGVFSLRRVFRVIEQRRQRPQQLQHEAVRRREVRRRVPGCRVMEQSVSPRARQPASNSLRRSQHHSMRPVTRLPSP
ncbi:unnamed protein product [Chrysodeixis includens]|uniref:Uncharacterized protein n=1 Tax=Chrysodeixis includens TaxID=689277 RepID=A0A9N8Q1T8_CHRIL|nr:unnamed protein product [Chrysodeixis includens]